MEKQERRKRDAKKAADEKNGRIQLLDQLGQRMAREWMHFRAPEEIRKEAQAVAAGRAERMPELLRLTEKADGRRHSWASPMALRLRRQYIHEWTLTHPGAKPIGVGGPEWPGDTTRVVRTVEGDYRRLPVDEVERIWKERRREAWRNQKAAQRARKPSSE